MIEIIPAVLPKNFETIERAVEKIKGYTPILQIDICDGVFVKNSTWPYSDGTDSAWQAILAEQEGMPFWDQIDYELDLMIAHPERQLSDLMKIGPSRLIFHIESLENPNSFFDHLDSYIYDVCEIGIGISIETPIESLFDCIENKNVSFVQCMGITKIGNQGQVLNDAVVEKVMQLKKRYPSLPIAVDGGVTLENAQALIDAGATRLVSGTALFESEDIHSTINYFKSLK